MSDNNNYNNSDVNNNNYSNRINYMIMVFDSCTKMLKMNEAANINYLHN